MRDDVLQVRSLLVCFYVLRDEKGLYLIDTGFIGGPYFLRKALKNRGWGNLPILGIILTHGHLDHILNAHRLAKDTGAWVAAPELDKKHYEGQPSYTGISKATGWLESLGRRVLKFKSFQVDRYFHDGDELEIGSGLKVVSFPGHTMGHCGLYSSHYQILFSADLFDSFDGFSHLPPRFFNSDNQQARESVMKAALLDIKGVYPNHCDQASPEKHLERLREFIRE